MNEYVFKSREEAEKAIKEKVEEYYKCKEVHDRTDKPGLMKITREEAGNLYAEIKEICKLNNLKLEDYMK